MAGGPADPSHCTIGQNDSEYSVLPRDVDHDARAGRGERPQAERSC